MDRFEKKVTGLFIAAWIGAVALSLGGVGLTVWAVISLVNWITAQNFQYLAEPLDGTLEY